MSYLSLLSVHSVGFWNDRTYKYLESPRTNHQGQKDGGVPDFFLRFEETGCRLEVQQPIILVQRHKTCYRTEQEVYGAGSHAYVVGS